jgi:hypothetical protein
MEFFQIVDVSTTQEVIQEKLTLANLEEFCGSIFMLEGDSQVCQTGGMWGEFMVRRDLIMGGVRFSMLDCPNALAWTVTTGYPPDRDKVVVHLTINRERKQKEFIEEIYQFLEDIQLGLQKFLTAGGDSAI